MILINKANIIAMCKDRNMQWSIGSYLVAMFVLNIFLDKFSDTIFYSQMIFVAVAGFRAYLLYRNKKC